MAKKKDIMYVTQIPTYCVAFYLVFTAHYVRIAVMYMCHIIQTVLLIPDTVL